MKLIEHPGLHLATLKHAAKYRLVSTGYDAIN